MVSFVLFIIAAALVIDGALSLYFGFESGREESVNGSMAQIVASFFLLMVGLSFLDAEQEVSEESQVLTELSSISTPVDGDQNAVNHPVPQTTETPKCDPAIEIVSRDGEWVMIKNQYGEVITLNQQDLDCKLIDNY